MACINGTGLAIVANRIIEGCLAAREGIALVFCTCDTIFASAITWHMDTSIFWVTGVVCTGDAIVTQGAIHQEDAARLVGARIDGALDAIYAGWIGWDIQATVVRIAGIC